MKTETVFVVVGELLLVFAFMLLARHIEKLEMRVSQIEARQK